ncbi:MAG: hypothetical protein JWM74_3782 [Myxococcaceae bacterium]|nr:hypothetical protein [Myxococcaceae bacterium]
MWATAITTYSSLCCTKTKAYGKRGRKTRRARGSSGTGLAVTGPVSRWSMTSSSTPRIHHRGRRARARTTGRPLQLPRRHPDGSASDSFAAAQALAQISQEGPTLGPPIATLEHIVGSTTNDFCPGRTSVRVLAVETRQQFLRKRGTFFLRQVERFREHVFRSRVHPPSITDLREVAVGRDRRPPPCPPRSGNAVSRFLATW